MSAAPKSGPNTGPNGERKAASNTAGAARQSGARRIELVDALRAFALFGILQVNIQSFVWGAGDPLGYFVQPPSASDALTHVLIGTFVSIKFMSIFAFLFGFGFALQMRSLRRRTGSLDEARRTYRRRLFFLLIVGLAHGVLLYYGDILAFYALGGFILVLYADARPARLARATRNWWLVAFFWSVLWIVAAAMFSVVLPVDEDPAQVPSSTLARLAVYTQGGFFEQALVRVEDAWGVLATSVALSLPHVVALFLLGALAGRLGWLAAPARHARIWRAATWIGLAALPFAGLGAWLNFAAMRDAPGDPSLTGYGLQLAGSAMFCLYVALFVRARERPAMQRMIAWLAPVGRMPLTNYLAQSVIMGALLSGWGFGLALELSRAALALLAIAIVGVQVFASRAWIARFGQGPVERLWHAWTYRGAEASRSTRSTFSQTPR